MTELDAALADGAHSYNQFLEQIWSARQGEIRYRAEKALDELEAKEARFSEVGGLDIDFSAPPALDLKASTHHPEHLTVSLRAPGTGFWSLGFDARVRIFGRSKKRKEEPDSSSPDLHEAATRPRGHKTRVKVDRLAVGLRFELQKVSELEYRWVRGPEIDTDVRIDLDSSNLLFDLLLELFEGAVNRLIDRKVTQSLLHQLPNLEKIDDILDLHLASKPPVISITDAPRDRLEETARHIADRVAREQMPWGAVLSAGLGRNDPSSPVVSYLHFQDAAIWTGHYLAAESLRFALTGESEAAEHVDLALGGLELLARLTVDPGLLSRVAVPADSPVAAEVIADMKRRDMESRLFTAESDGRRYQSIGHITRDQYAGAFLGAGFAALHVDEPGIRDRARRLVLEMASYLLERRWCPAEVRSSREAPELTSVTYAVDPSQVLAILRLAQELDPDRFGEAYRGLAEALPCLWLFRWLQSLDPVDSYYKFNLMHSLALVSLPLEQDPAKRLRLAESFRVVRRMIRNHDNAYFNLVELATLGDQPEALSRPREEIEREVRQELTLWLDRPELWEKGLGPDKSKLDLVTFPGLGGNEAEVIDRQPVAVDQRPSSDFLWQRSPFRVEGVQDIPENVFVRPPGIDLVLPYWLARWTGVL